MLPTSRPFVLLEGNWSILAYEPIAIIEFYKGDVNQHLKQLDQITALLHKLNKEKTDLPFTNGLIGFFSYDFGNQLYGITNDSFPNTPLSYWIIPQKIIINGQEINHTYSDIEIAQIKKLALQASSPKTQSPNSKASTELTSNLTKSTYKQNLAKINDHITAGNTYQVNFAQQFSLRKNLDPIQIYQQISQNNPAPYQALIVTNDFNVISNSPELLIKYNKNQLITEPIKGTDTDSDRLLKSEKADAELTMIVDLSRNDIGKLSKPGTVMVNKHRALMQRKHFYHTYSQITGTPKANLTVSEIIKAMFPGGSITGCPKYRTMQIIQQLEPTPRGVYCGSAGFINHTGELMLNIMIRTLWQQNNNLSLHAGGGIVADSVTSEEYEETLQKARAFLEIIT